MTSNAAASAPALTTIRTGTPIVIARLTVREAFDYSEPQEYAGHDRTIRVERGSYDIIAICDWRSAFVAIRFTGTLVRNTWNGKPTGGERPGARATASCPVYVYDVARIAAGTAEARGFWSGGVELAEGFKLIADDGAIMCETTGELIVLGCAVRASEVAAHLAHVAKVRAEMATPRELTGHRAVLAARAGKGTLRCSLPGNEGEIAWIDAMDVVRIDPSLIVLVPGEVAA